MKLISKIVVFGAFFCGALAQASNNHETLLSFNDFMSLNKGQKVAYVRTLRDALLRAEKAQVKSGIKYQAQTSIPKFPNLQSIFFSEALAADTNNYCIYGGNISHLTGDYCHTLTGGPCSNSAYPSQCNSFLFGNNVCVAVPSDKYKVNDATKACFDKVLTGKTPEQIEQIDQKIVDGIENNETNRAAWQEFGTQLKSYCGEADSNSWKNKHQKDLCNRVMDRWDDMKNALNKKLSFVPAEAPHADIAADLPINGGCEYTVDLKHYYHIDYSLDHGIFRPINHAPGYELFSTDTRSDNCADGKTIPSSCNLYFTKTSSTPGKTVTQEFKLTGANAPGAVGGGATCTVEHIGEDIQVLDETKDNVDCLAAGLGNETQKFCVGEHEGIFKAVVFVDHGHHGENGVRVCESTTPGGPWTVSEETSSALDRKINSTSLAMAKNHGSWWKFGKGKKTIEMRFNDGSEDHISRHKPRGGEKMTDGIQQCEFYHGETVGDNEPSGNTKYFNISGLTTSDGKGNAPTSGK